MSYDLRVWEQPADREPPATLEQQRATKADMRKVMATFLRECVRKHGFEHDPSIQDADVGFTRSTSAGRQTITLTVEGAVPRLSCKIYCRHRNERVQEIFGDVFGAQWLRRGTLAFNIGVFVGAFNAGLPFSSRQEIARIFELLELKAMPVLDAARSLTGLNEVMNRQDRFPLDHQVRHPDDSRSLAQYLHRHSFEPLIVAWLVQDPEFDALVEEYREYTRNRVDMTTADLDKLLGHLRADVPAGEEGSDANDA